MLEFAVSAENLQFTSTDQAALAIDEAAAMVSPGSRQSLDITSISLRQGEVKLWGKGEVGLDDQNRLQGKIATTTNDLDGLLDAAAPLLQLTEKDRRTLELVLGLLGKEIKADIIFRNGEMYWGPLKLGDLTPLF